MRTIVALNFSPKEVGAPLNVVTGTNLFTDICGDESFEDSIYLSSNSYKEIFGKNRSEDNRNRRRLAIVKITSEVTGRSIYRKFVFNPFFIGLNETNLALHPSSIRELGDNSTIVGSNATLSKGSVFLYFWNHPFHATRISMKLGVTSIVLALLSICASIIVRL